VQMSQIEDPLDRPVRLAFVGTLYELKRVVLLLRALHSVPGKWVLKLVGDGPDRRLLTDLSVRLGLKARLEFAGSIPHEKVMAALCHCDAVVLPSRYDGWGAVVGEALCHGARAIASDACGSATLLGDPSRGFTFQSGNVSDLACKLSQVVEDGPRSPEQRLALATWARCIQGESLAKYLDQTVDWFLSGQGEPPHVPWQSAPVTPK
jgi:glycosyltransferase involved in cell wall biosynthesis